MINGKTELTAAFTALLNGIFGILSGLGILNLSPELIASMNGVLIPLVMIFLGNRVTKVENQAITAAVQASVGAATAKRVEAAQPEPGK